MADSEDVACKASEMAVIVMGVGSTGCTDSKPREESEQDAIKAPREGKLSTWAYACLLGILRMQALRS